MPPKSTSQIINAFWKATNEIPSAYLYAILDCARNESIYPKLIGSDEEYRCLYKGKLPAEMAAVAQYLVRFHSGSKFLEYMVEKGWGDNWGIFFSSSTYLGPLESHFREFILASTEEGNVFYFRFYDPRVFRVYLPTCNPSELNRFFGPVAVYLIEDETPDSISRFTLRSGMLHRDNLWVGNGS